MKKDLGHIIKEMADVAREVNNDITQINKLASKIKLDIVKFSESTSSFYDYVNDIGVDKEQS